MDKKMHLIPFKVEEITDQVGEIPKGVRMIQAPEVWDKGRKGEGVVIAVIDTGCQPDHPDLQGRIIEGKNFSNDGGPDDYADRVGHGTHVAGTIAAIFNQRGVAGVAPEADLLILKVFDSDGYARNESVIKAIDYAISWRKKEKKVRVISMSLGSPVDDPKLHDAVRRAVDKEIAVVCAAGNRGDNRAETPEIEYPAGYPESICIGAVDLNKKLTEFTNTNDQVDLVAPGKSIQSTWIGGKYATISGTSMATPHVSGAVALIINQCELEFGRTLSEAEVYAQLIKRTVSLGYPKMAEGNGLIILAQDTCRLEKTGNMRDREVVSV